MTRISKPMLACAAIAACCAHAADQPQWGERHTRNMVSPETGLPAAPDPSNAALVKWQAPLGNNAYGSPVIAQGRVLVGANNETPRDPRIQGDRAVLLCLDEATGALVWQLAVPRIGGDDYLDWPEIAMCTPPAVEGRRVYTVTNRYDVVCLDLDGMANGNDGPETGEGQYMAGPGNPPLGTAATDADILWRFNMPEQTGMYPHDSAHCPILIDGDVLYLNTGNGVDNTHAVVRKPEAPSLIALDKATGRLLAHDAEGIGHRLFHAIWSPPALGLVDGRPQLVLGGADGVVYGFGPITPSPAVQTFKRVWQFDCDPAAPKTNLAEWLRNRKEGPSAIESMPVLIDGRVYVTAGGDIWWGKEQAWLMCIDATKTGDRTPGGPIWSYPIPAHCVSTPAVANGLVFVGDDKGVVHCVDAATGAAQWTHRLGGDIWGSALAAGGRVYIASRNKKLGVYKAAKDLEVLAATEFEAPIVSTPTAANGTLYVNTLKTLYAFAER